MLIGKTSEEKYDVVVESDTEFVEELRTYSTEQGNVIGISRFRLPGTLVRSYRITARKAVLGKFWANHLK